jgi:hypothetical protein
MAAPHPEACHGLAPRRLAFASGSAPGWAAQEFGHLPSKSGIGGLSWAKPRLAVTGSTARASISGVGYENASQTLWRARRPLAANVPVACSATATSGSLWTVTKACASRVTTSASVVH